jgi:hypothetical protein
MYVALILVYPFLSRFFLASGIEALGDEIGGRRDEGIYPPSVKPPFLFMTGEACN